MRVLVTGSTGYIGSRLVPSLLSAGHTVYAAMRDPSRVRELAWGDRVEARPFDLEEPSSALAATEGIDAAYHLVHAMAEGDFVRKDREAAQVMAAACETHEVGRLVYLSGLVPDADELSDHLRSRLEVERVFLDSAVPATVLRAAVIIGSGSTSFELVRRLSERLPVIPLPAWMGGRVQPIAVEDVVHLLTAALDGPARNDHYDVGGDDVVSYPELLDAYARVAGLRRVHVPVPIVPPAVVGPVVSAITGIPRGTVTALVESLEHDMVCHDHRIRDEVGDGHRYLGLDEALRRSLAQRDDATQPGGDVQASAPSDPEWAGGDVWVDGDRPVHEPRSLLSRLALGIRRDEPPGP